MRVGDTERWAVDARLQQAVGEGLLTLAEYEQRAGEVWAARTRAAIEAVSRDLPAAPAPVPAPMGRAPRTRRSLALMSGDELRGPVAPGQGLEAYAVMGGALVDLRRDDLPAEVHVRAVAVMGGIEVLVPRGVEVHLSGLSVMGGRDLKLDPPRPGAPLVHVDAYALMGGVEVKHGKESERVDAAPVPEPRGSVPLTAAPPVVPAVRAHRRSRGRSRLAGLVLAAGALVAVGSTVDHVSVFGSQVVRTGDSGRSVGVLFGSVTVVVPDNAAVDSRGLVVFGSTECDTACSGGGARVRSYGAFGSVEIVTEAEQAAEAEEDASRDPAEDD